MSEEHKPLEKLDEAKITLEFRGVEAWIWFPLSLPHRGTLEQVQIQGSFTSWELGTEMEKTPYGFLYPLGPQDLQAPGNSGFPEATFLVNKQEWYGYDFFVPADHVLHHRLLAIVSPQRQQEWLDLQQEVNRWVQDYYDPYILANTRSFGNPEAGLWRSYHPFMLSKFSHPREQNRIEAVQDFMAKVKPGAVINLSDQREDWDHYSLPLYYQDLAEKGAVGLLNADYEVVYYKSSSIRFKKLLWDVLQFIAHHQGPYWIHCRLGVDRTGVVAAVLSLLSGSSWEQTAQDYVQSNKTGILEHRSAKLLEYSLSRFLGEPVGEVSPLHMVEQIRRSLWAHLPLDGEHIWDEALQKLGGFA